MARRIFVFVLMLICIPITVLASKDENYMNTYEEFSENNDLSVEISDGYTNDLIYNENYDYTLGYDDEDNFEAKSLKGKIIYASEAFEHDNGYVKSLAQNIKVEIVDKEHNGEVYDIVYYLEDDYNTKLPLYEELKVNDRVYVYANFENDVLVGEAFIQFYDKTGWIILLSVIFAALIIAIGGKKGIKALIGLVITIALIFGVLIPGILVGRGNYVFDSEKTGVVLEVLLDFIQEHPVFLTVMVCCLIIFLTFIIVSGFHKKTFAAICGTIAGVVAAGVLGSVFSDLMMLGGINEDARILSVSIEEKQTMFDFKGIMLVGIMISALGACMDVGMSIASSLSELKTENPNMTTGKLIKSGMNIGKDVMGTMTNTLILAYVGSAMLCILLYTINGFELSTVLNQEDISMEVLKSLAGSIGLVCTIPLTAVISGLIMGSDSEKKSKPNHKKDTDEDVKLRYFNG